jgi:hypothetical protein
LIEKSNKNDLKNLKNNRDWITLHCSCKNESQNTEIVIFFLEKKADINSLANKM